MSIVVVTPPANPPVSVDELQSQLRIRTDAERDVLSWYVLTAVEVCENKSRRTFVNTSFRLRVSANCPVKVPRSPFVSVESCKDGEDNAVAYELDETGNYAVLTPASYPDVLVVEFVAGYGAEPSLVPMCARHAVRIAASHYWRYRGDDEMPPLPPAVDALLDPIRLREVC